MLANKYYMWGVFVLSIKSETRDKILLNKHEQFGVYSSHVELWLWCWWQIRKKGNFHFRSDSGHIYLLPSWWPNKGWSKLEVKYHWKSNNPTTTTLTHLANKSHAQKLFTKSLPVWNIQGERAAIDVPIYWPAQAYSRPRLCNVESLCRCRRNDWSLNLYILAIIKGYPIQSWVLDRRGSKAVTPCTLQMGISL